MAASPLIRRTAQGVTSTWANVFTGLITVQASAAFVGLIVASSLDGFNVTVVNSSLSAVLDADVSGYVAGVLVVICPLLSTSNTSQANLLATITTRDGLSVTGPPAMFRRMWRCSFLVSNSSLSGSGGIVLVLVVFLSVVESSIVVQGALSVLTANDALGTSGGKLAVMGFAVALIFRSQVKVTDGARLRITVARSSQTGSPSPVVAYVVFFVTSGVRTGGCVIEGLRLEISDAARVTVDPQSEAGVAGGAASLINATAFAVWFDAGEMRASSIIVSQRASIRAVSNGDSRVLFMGAMIVLNSLFAIRGGANLTTLGKGTSSILTCAEPAVWTACRVSIFDGAILHSASTGETAVVRTLSLKTLVWSSIVVWAGANLAATGIPGDVTARTVLIRKLVSSFILVNGTATRVESDCEGPRVEVNAGTGTGATTYAVDECISSYMFVQGGARLTSLAPILAAKTMLFQNVSNSLIVVQGGGTVVEALSTELFASTTSIVEHMDESIMILQDGALAQAVGPQAILAAMCMLAVVKGSCFIVRGASNITAISSVDTELASGSCALFVGNDVRDTFVLVEGFSRLDTKGTGKPQRALLGLNGGGTALSFGIVRNTTVAVQRNATVAARGTVASANCFSIAASAANLSVVVQGGSSIVVTGAADPESPTGVLCATAAVDLVTGVSLSLRDGAVIDVSATSGSAVAFWYGPEASVEAASVTMGTNASLRVHASDGDALFFSFVRGQSVQTSFATGARVNVSCHRAAGATSCRTEVLAFSTLLQSRVLIADARTTVTVSARDDPRSSSVLLRVASALRDSTIVVTNRAQLMCLSNPGSTNGGGGCAMMSFNGSTLSLIAVNGSAAVAQSGGGAAASATSLLLFTQGSKAPATLSVPGASCLVLGDARFQQSDRTTAYYCAAGDTETMVSRPPPGAPPPVIATVCAQQYCYPPFGTSVATTTATTSTTSTASTTATVTVATSTTTSTSSLTATVANTSQPPIVTPTTFTTIAPVTGGTPTFAASSTTFPTTQTTTAAPTRRRTPTHLASRSRTLSATMVPAPPAATPPPALLTAGATITSGAAAIGATPATALIVSRLTAMQSIGSCTDEPDLEASLPVADSPLRMSVLLPGTAAGSGAAGLAPYFGLIVGDTLLLAGLAALHAGVAGARYAWRGAAGADAWAAAMAWARFPSLLVVPHTMLLPPVLEAALVVLVQGSEAATRTPAGAVVLAFALGAAWAGATAAGLHWVFRRALPAYADFAPFSAAPDDTGHGNRRLVARLVRVFESAEAGEWVDKLGMENADDPSPGDDAPKGRGSFVRRFELLFCDYHGRCGGYLGAEIAASCFYGLGAALTFWSCRAANGVLIATVVGYLGSMVYLRPHVSRLHYGIGVFFAGLQLLLAALTVAHNATSQRYGRLASAVFVTETAIVYLALLRTVYDVSRVVYLFVRRKAQHLQRQRERAAEQSRQEEVEMGSLRRGDGDPAVATGRVLTQPLLGVAAEPERAPRRRRRTAVPDERSPSASVQPSADVVVPPVPQPPPVTPPSRRPTFPVSRRSASSSTVDRGVPQWQQRLNRMREEEVAAQALLHDTLQTTFGNLFALARAQEDFTALQRRIGSGAEQLPEKSRQASLPRRRRHRSSEQPPRQSSVAASFEDDTEPMRGQRQRRQADEVANYSPRPSIERHAPVVALEPMTPQPTLRRSPHLDDAAATAAVPRDDERGCADAELSSVVAMMGTTTAPRGMEIAEHRRGLDAGVQPRGEIIESDRLARMPAKPAASGALLPAEIDEL